MKSAKKLIILLLISMMGMISCQKEEQGPSAKEYMQANINGQMFAAANFVVAKAAATTSINGIIGPASNAESIGISIQDAKVGTFALSENTDYFAVYKSTTHEYMSLSGTLQITLMTAEWIEGSFSFQAHSMDDPAAKVLVSEGKFKLQMD